MNFMETQTTKEFQPGATIFREKDPGSSMFIIQSGEVEVTTEINDQKVILATLKSGSVFGEMALVDDSPRSATVIAKTKTKCVEISRMLFNKRLETVPAWMKSFYQILIERLRDANRQHKSVSSHDVAKQIVFLLVTFLSNAKPNISEEYHIPWQDTAKHISFLLNIPFNQVANVMNKLSLTPLAESKIDYEKGRLFYTTDLGQFKKFADFCEQLFLAKLGKETTLEYQEQSPEELQILKFFNKLLGEQATASDFHLNFLEERCLDDLGKPFESFKFEINDLVRKGVLVSRVDQDNDKYFEVNRELFEKKMGKSTTFELFSKIEKKLGWS